MAVNDDLPFWKRKSLAEMTEAMARGWEGRDSRSVMLLSQERAGVNIAVDPEKLKEAMASK